MIPKSNAPDPSINNPAAGKAAQVRELLFRMTLDEKIGQMTLVDKNSISPDDVSRYAIGAVLSGGGGYPADNSPGGWLRMVSGYQEAALRTRLGIPLLYGVDAVHGHGNLRGAVIFPHNIGLGATRDAELVYRIGRATAEETVATGIRWNYAPTIAVPQDIRWGRTYEGFAQEASLVTKLGAAYIEGLQGEDLSDPLAVLATPKHFVGDGGTTWGTSTKIFMALPAFGYDEPFPYKIDQGDTRVGEATLRAVHLQPYIAAVQAGAQTVMASFSSWNGQPLHAHHKLLTEVLKGELGFDGYVVSDWGGIGQVGSDYYQAIVACINAGVDMSMLPQDFLRFMKLLSEAVRRGDVSEARIDDAVRRILTVKARLNLFERPMTDPGYLSLVGTEGHRALAREAAGKSLVLLKNEGDTLPIPKSLPLIFVAGRWADDIGLQCGGWTIEWLGKAGRITPGTTILEAIRATVSPETIVAYDSTGAFAQALDSDGQPMMADVGLAVVGEEPYAEGFGDQADPTLSEEAVALIECLRNRVKRLVVILITGRPLILGEHIGLMDGLIAAWLPGSEGQGVADVLCGDIPFTGKLPYAWPRSIDQIPLKAAETGQESDQSLYPFGFGLGG